MFLFRSFALGLMLLLACRSSSIIAQTPDWLWSKTSKSTNGSYASAVSVAKNGDVIVVGDFGSAALSFGGDTLYGFNGSVFLVRFDAAGNLIWFRQSGLGSCNIKAMTLDPSGNIVITGSFTAPTLRFGATTLTLSGSKDVFLAKFDSLGNPLWAKSAASSGGAEGTGICADASGNIGITGNFTDAVTFGSTNLTRMPSSLIDVFTVKYSASGAVLWAKSAGSPFIYDHSAAITADPSGNFFITGDFQGQMGFGGGVSITTSTEIAVFMAKYNGSGVIQWARKAGGTGGESGGTSVAADKDGNVFVTGYYYCSPAMTIGSFSLPNKGNIDAFVAKYSAAGTPIWAKSGGGNEHDIPNKIVTDQAGNAYMTGDYASYDAQFDTFTLSRSYGSGNSFFVTKYDGSGVVKWVKTGGNTPSNTVYTGALAVNNCNEVYVAGVYTIILNLSPTAPLPYRSAGSMFVAKLGNVLTTISKPVCFGDNTGSATASMLVGAGPFTYSWSTGGTAATETGLGVGVYTVTVTDASGCANQSLVNIASLSDMTATFTNAGFRCSGPCAGTITAIPAKGFTPYRYLWDANAGDQAIATAANLCPGTYYVRVTDSMNCVKTFSVTAAPNASMLPQLPLLNISTVDGANIDPLISSYYHYDLPGTIVANPDNPYNFVNAGKNVRLKVKTLNRSAGGIDYPGGQVTARTNSPYITITDTLAGFNPIVYGDSAWSIDELEIKINETTPPGTIAYFDVVIYSDAAQYSTCVGVPVAPLVIGRQNDTTVTDDNTGNSSGNGNRYCENGEIIEFKPLLNNVSPRAASYVVSTFEDLDANAYIDIWNGRSGVSGMVNNRGFWNFTTAPQTIASGQADVTPQHNFVFGYYKTAPSDNLQLYNVITAGIRPMLGVNGRLAPFRWAATFEFNSTHVGVGKVTANTEVVIAPNPTTGHITITMPYQSGKCVITDVTGRVVLTKNFTGSVIDMDVATAVGVYIAHITNTATGATIAKKFVVQ